MQIRKKKSPFSHNDAIQFFGLPVLLFNEEKAKKNSLIGPYFWGKCHKILETLKGKLGGVCFLL